MTRETPEMIELEEIRAAHSKELAGMSFEEELRHYRDECEKARQELGLNLPRAETQKESIKTRK